MKIRDIFGTFVLPAAFSLLWVGCAAPQPAGSTSSGTHHASGEDVVALRVAHDMTGEVVLAKRDGMWIVEDGVEPVDARRLAEAFRELSELDKGTAVAGADAAFEYELDPDRAKTVTLTYRDGRTKALLLGRKSGDYTVTYWRESEGDSIYRVAGNTSWGLSTAPKDWKSRSVFPSYEERREPWDVRMSWTDSSGAHIGYRLLRVREDSAILVEPDTVTVPRPKAMDLLGRVMQMVVDDFADENEKRMLRERREGGVAPLATLVIVLEDGTRLETRAIGESGSHYYIERSSGGFAKVNKWRLHDLMIPPEILSAPIPLGPYPDDGTDLHRVPFGIGVFVPHGFEPEGRGEDAGGVEHDPHDGHGH